MELPNGQLSGLLDDSYIPLLGPDVPLRICHTDISPSGVASHILFDDQFCHLDNIPNYPPEIGFPQHVSHPDICPDVATSHPNRLSANNLAHAPGTSWHHVDQAFEGQDRDFGFSESSVTYNQYESSLSGLPNLPAPKLSS